jgi:hypothetical protein
MRYILGAICLLFSVFALPLGGANASTAIISGVPVDAVIMRAGATAAKIKRLKSVPSVGLIDLSKRRGPRYASEFDAIIEYRLTVQRNAGGVKALRAALRGNAVTRKALTSRGIDIGRVVAVDVGSNGALRVFIL